MTSQERLALEYAVTATAPLVRILSTRFRVTYPLFVDALKTAYVSAARESLSQQRRDSKKKEYGFLSLMSGVSQTEVKRISETLDCHERSGNRPVCAEAIVISEWNSNDFWQTSNGHPDDLPLNGPYGKKNFSTLVRKTIGNISYGTMANALVGAGVAKKITVDGENRLRLLASEFEPANGNELDMFKVGCAMIERLGRATEDNLEMSNEDIHNRHFQHDFYSYKIPYSKLPQFREAMKELMREFSYDRLVPAMESFESSNDLGSCLTETGVGLYFWEKRRAEQSLLPYEQEKSI
ncbi:MAG: DUF6502 family protein [Pseudomonadota bacterium]